MLPREKGDPEVQSTISKDLSAILSSVKAREDWNVPEEWTGPNTAPVDPVLPSNISQLPATYTTRKEYRPEEENEGLKTDSTPPPPGGHGKPVAKEDASAHKTQTPDRGQLWGQVLKPGFPQTRRKDLVYPSS